MHLYECLGAPERRHTGSAIVENAFVTFSLCYRSKPSPIITAQTV